MLQLEEEEEDHDDEEYYQSLPSNEQMPDVEGRGDDAAEEMEDDGDIELFNESDDSENEDEIVYQTGNIRYSSEPFAHHRLERNILNEASRTLTHPTTEAESFFKYIDEGMLRTLQRFTNRKAADIRRSAPRQYKWMNDFSYDDVLACLGILISAGVDRDNFTAIEDLWNPVDSRPFYRIVMSYQRFKFFLRAVRFDNFRDRATRLSQDKLAAIRDFWNEFVTNLRRFYIPEDVVTVDEQLVGYRGRAPGRTYIPSKPRKYGVKIFWACEAQSGYALNGIIYTGKQGNEVHRNLGHDVVMELMRPFFGSGREVVTDNFFTSHKLALSLLQENLTLLGTMRSHRKEVPEDLRNKQRPATSSLFAFDHQNKITLVSYIPKRNKNVIMLSSSHTGK